MSFYDDVRNFLGDLERQETRTENEKRAYALLASIRPVLNRALDENRVLKDEISLMRLWDDGSEEIACLRKENAELKEKPIVLAGAIRMVADLIIELKKELYYEAGDPGLRLSQAKAVVLTLKQMIPSLIAIQEKAERFERENEELKNQPVFLLARRVEALEARLDASHWLGPSPRKFGVDPYPWERLFGNSTCDPLPPTPKTFCGPSSGTEPASDPEAKAYYTETR